MAKKPRTNEIVPNQNISFPIGTIYTVENLYQVLNCSKIFGKHKKNGIEIKPLRVWTDNSIYGALIIGFIAQLFVSLMRYEISELKHTSTKFIKTSLSNLTVTVDSWERKVKTYVYSNFDAINVMVLRSNWAVSGGEMS